MNKPEIKDQDAHAFLSFFDYIEKREHLSKDWITVGRMDPSGIDDQRTIFSLLTERKNFDAVLKKTDWETDDIQFVGEGHFNFGHPYFINTGNGIGFNTGSGRLGNITFEPFVLLRTEVGNYKAHFEIIQNFILYHDLRQSKSGHYVDPNNEDTVIRIISPEYVNVRAHHLRDYLSARNMILIRYIDYERVHPSNIQNIISNEEYITQIKELNTNYNLKITSSARKDHSFSWLHGKEIIYPYPEPHHHEFLFFTGKDERTYEKFKIDIDDNGNPIMLECHPWKSPMKLCYFKKEVLNKYYSDTKNFTIEGNSLIYKHSSWVLPYGINEEDLVHVWLKDLGNLPHDEQLYWKSNNVLPSGGINNTFLRRQMMCEYTESDDPMEQLLCIYRNINPKFQKKFGFKLFNDLSVEDKYLEKITHGLVMYEQNEFDQQVLYLSKIFVDSINKSKLEENTKWIPSNGNENGSIYFLEHFLKEQSKDNEQIEEICESLRILQSIRSTSVAHVKSTEYSENLKKKLKLSAFNIQDAWDTLIGTMIKSMKMLQSLIS